MEVNFVFHCRGQIIHELCVFVITLIILITPHRLHKHLWKDISFNHLHYKEMSCGNACTEHIQRNAYTHTHRFHSLTPRGATLRKVRLHFGCTTREVIWKERDSEKTQRRRWKQRGGIDQSEQGARGLLQQNYTLDPAAVVFLIFFWPGLNYRIKGHLRTQHLQLMIVFVSSALSKQEKGEDL